MILAQPLLGSTVKCEDDENAAEKNDPYAFLTVLNLHEHRSKSVVQQLSKYLLERTSTLLPQLTKLLDPSNSSAQVGLILTERFINIPHQVIPPMYNMLLEEMQWANEEKEPYQFTHYLVISKTYTEVSSKLDAEDDRPAKKSKAAKGTGSEIFYFHPEDEILQKHALASSSFDYVKQSESDSKRAFQELGVRPQGHVILLEGSKFEGAVKAVNEYLSGGDST